MTGVDVLDPRFDPEPAYWTRLRKRAGLRADWSWPALSVQAWLARTPQLVTVFRDGDEPHALVCAAWVTESTRRDRFAGGDRRGRFGFLDVRSPDTSLPGWWLADYDPGARPGRLREFVGAYAAAMRRELGVGMRGLLLRQLGEAEVPEVTGRLRKVRSSEPVSVVHTAGHRSEGDWLATLTKKRRTEMRKISREVAADPAIEVRVRTGAEENVETLTRLLRHNAEKYAETETVPILPLPPFGGALAEVLRQPDVRTVDYSDSATGRRLAVALVLDHPEWPVVRRWSALPVEERGTHNLYKHLYSELVRWSIADGKRGFVVGKAMTKVKASLGAEQIPQFAAAIPVW